MMHAFDRRRFGGLLGAGALGALGALGAGLPGLIVPALRPYRSRGKIGSWMKDDSVLRYLDERLAGYRCAAVGEFHHHGEDADLPPGRPGSAGGRGRGRGRGC